MIFTVKIELGNDEMRTGDDVAGALRVVADTLIERIGSTEFDDQPLRFPPIRDLNGNRVGFFAVNREATDMPEVFS